ncbi:MAG: hypothetical protein KIT80_02015 [Chitinophagaceae bacterium]|nr:hypothetical protein [Chitinophagaceae bacterium]MCW5925660.1 hypothetical protein [Chitinophagaceae bacterium]
MPDDDKLNDIKLVMTKRKNFYLFYKEAINNIAKYSEAKNVWIKMHIVDNRFYLSVKDDGKGFNLNNKTEGNGLASMKKRAFELNGTFTIHSAPGEGTEVKLNFHL